MAKSSWILLGVALIYCHSAFAQGLGPLGIDIEAKLEESQRNLRTSMVQLRDVRLSSCKMGNARDCDLVTLSDIEIALLDIEVKYQRASRRASQGDVESFKKVKEAAAEARDKVGEVIDVLK